MVIPYVGRTTVSLDGAEARCPLSGAQCVMQKHLSKNGSAAFQWHADACVPAAGLEHVARPAQAVIWLYLMHVA